MPPDSPAELLPITFDRAAAELASWPGLFFEPDGSVMFADAEGNPSTDGAASIAFLPVGGGGLQSAQAIVITNTGLVRTFSASR